MVLPDGLLQLHVLYDVGVWVSATTTLLLLAGACFLLCFSCRGSSWGVTPDFLALVVGGYGAAGAELEDAFGSGKFLTEKR